MDFHVNDAVVVSAGVGTIEYLGPLPFSDSAKQIWAGIELTSDNMPIDNGNDDGTGKIHDISFFRCKKGYSFWCPITEIERKITPKELLLKIVHLNDNLNILRKTTSNERSNNDMSDDAIFSTPNLSTRNFLRPDTIQTSVSNSFSEVEDYPTPTAVYDDDIEISMHPMLKQKRGSISQLNKKIMRRLSDCIDKKMLGFDWNEIERHSAKILNIMTRNASASQVDLMDDVCMVLEASQPTHWRRTMDHILRALISRDIPVYVVIAAAIQTYQINFHEFGHFLTSRSINSWASDEVIKWINDHGFYSERFEDVTGALFWKMSKQQLIARGIPDMYADHLIKKREQSLYSLHDNSVIEYTLRRKRLYLFLEAFNLGNRSDGTLGQSIVDSMPRIKDIIRITANHRRTIEEAL